MKKMFALVYTYEGDMNHIPYSCVIAVSESKDKIIAELQKCVTESTTETDDEDDDYYEKNFVIEKNYEDITILKWKHNPDLYIKYEIQSVEVI
jgi:hypothetical protein